KVKRGTSFGNLPDSDIKGVEFERGGVLKINRTDGTTLYLNPTTWIEVEETPAQYDPKDSVL
ncbi:MAG: hypothetical protein ACLPLP_21015, partial [Mycobacterium sp.]